MPIPFVFLMLMLNGDVIGGQFDSRAQCLAELEQHKPQAAFIYYACAPLKPATPANARKPGQYRL